MVRRKIEMQDESGDIYYPHTSSDIVFSSDGQSIEGKTADLLSRLERLENIPPIPIYDTFRYIRVSCAGSTQNRYINIVEIKAFVGSTNVALNKIAMDVVGQLTEGSLTEVTNNRLQGYLNETGATIDPGEPINGVYQRGGLTVDLGSLQAIDTILLYQWYGGSRQYRDVLIEVSKNKSVWHTVFDTKVSGQYVEGAEGKSIILDKEYKNLSKYYDYIVARNAQTSTGALRVATHNVHGAIYLDLALFKETISKEAINIIGMQEDDLPNTPSPFFNYDITKGETYKHNTVCHNTILGNLPITNPIKTVLPGTGEIRHVTQADTIWKGKKVTVFCTHFSWTEDANRPQQYAKLKQVMDACTSEYKIAIGDFNSKSSSEHAQLTGYVSVQGYRGKYYPTCIDGVTYTALDNIYVSPNIEILGAQVVMDMLGSDHRMLIADLLLK